MVNILSNHYYNDLEGKGENNEKRISQSEYR